MFATLRSLALAALLFVAAPVAAHAATPATPEGARALIEGMAQEAIGVLSAKSPPEVIKAKFNDLLISGFDIEQISKFTLGRYGRTATQSQQDEYRKLFADYIVGIYANRFKSYSGEQLAVNSIRADGDDYLVGTSIASPGNPTPVSVDWKLGKGPDGLLRVRDVIIENVSMSITQRSEFASILQNAGGNVDVLNAQLRAKLGK